VVCGWRHSSFSLFEKYFHLTNFRFPLHFLLSVVGLVSVFFFYVFIFWAVAGVAFTCLRQNGLTLIWYFFFCLLLKHVIILFWTLTPPLRAAFSGLLHSVTCLFIYFRLSFCRLNHTPFPFYDILLFLLLLSLAFCRVGSPSPSQVVHFPIVNAVLLIFEVCKRSY